MPVTMRAVLGALETLLVVGPAVAALLLVGEQVFARHFHHPWMVDWGDEVVVYLLIWSVFASLGRVTAEGAHIRTELLINMLSPRTGRMVEIGIALCGVAFLALLGWQGFRVAQEAFIYDDRTASSLRFPIWIYYAILPVASAGMVIGYIIHLARLLTGQKDAA